MSLPDREQRTRVTIGVTTYMRPAGLHKLLRSLDAIRLPDDDLFDLEVVIVDNDPGRSAEQVVRQSQGWFSPPIRYEVEPRRGIAHARNAVVTHSAGCDLLVFIDDDEFVTRDWLIELLDARRRYGADVVVGPVIPEFESDAPKWVIDGQEHLYHYPRYETGERITYGHTGNVLFSRSVLERGETSLFDERFGLTGSEDTYLFMQLVQAGVSIVWCDEAIAYETVPPSRTRLKWLLKRAYSGANSFAVAERLANPGRKTSLVRVAKAAVRIGTGIFGLPLTIYFGRSHFARMVTSMSKGAGMIMGTAGRTFEAYREIPAG